MGSFQRMALHITFGTMSKTHVMCKVEDDLRSRGPSLSVIPKAFPPFL